jgi:hypothetical protein
MILRGMLLAGLLTNTLTPDLTARERPEQRALQVFVQREVPLSVTPASPLIIAERSHEGQMMGPITNKVAKAAEMSDVERARKQLEDAEKDHNADVKAEHDTPAFFGEVKQSRKDQAQMSGEDVDKARAKVKEAEKAEAEKAAQAAAKNAEAQKPTPSPAPTKPTPTPEARTHDMFRSEKPMIDSRGGPRETDRMRDVGRIA